MRRLAALTLLAAVAAAQESKLTDWSGEWVTDYGLLTLEQEGENVTGTYGNNTLEGTAEEGKLVFTYAEGRISGEGEFELGEDGHSFLGKWQLPNGRRGNWRGWRKDPEAGEAPRGDFSGYWLTSLGTMHVKQKGDDVEGTYGAQGWATIEGSVSGRRLDFVWKRIRWSGPATVELSRDGKRFFGFTEGDRPAKWLGLRLEGWTPDAKPKAGETVQGIASNTMCYFLRAPDGWRKGKKTDAIVLLHGSNWTTKGMVWVTAKNWPEIGKRFMLIGIQGENWAEWSDTDDLRHNYTYVNWMGKSTFKGYPYTDRESPYLVHQVVEELKEKHGLDRVFVVGHSQGGFLAWFLLMHYPESFAGVAPLSCSLAFQTEPAAFDDEELRAAQRATPIAMVNGTKDPNWGVKTGNHSYFLFEGARFPMLAYFKPEAGHGYDFLPIGDAVAWMDALSTRDVKALRAFAEQRAGEGGWRDVAAALLRAEELKAGRKFKNLAAKLDAAAGKHAGKHLDAIRANANGQWIEPFLAWREQFEFAPAAREVMQAYHALQDEHDPKAEAMITEARKAFRSNDADTGWATYEEILAKWYACKRYRVVKRWLSQRK